MKMKNFTLLAAVALGAALLLSLSFRVAQAACDPVRENETCSALYRLSGNVSAVAGRSEQPSGAQSAIDDPRLPTVGILIHADHKLMESEARALLVESKTFRQTISPHTERDDFDTIVAKFDYESGFDRTLPGQSKTLAQRIDEADQDLRRGATYTLFSPSMPMKRVFATRISVAQPCSTTPSRTRLWWICATLPPACAKACARPPICA